MLNSLSLIIIMVLTLFLAFYCVDTHKEYILTMVNSDKNSIKSVSVNVEENLSKEAVKNVKPIEKVYVEVLAEKEQNESQTVTEKVAPVSIEIEQEQNESQVVIEEVAPAPVKIEQDVEIVEPAVETIEKEKVIEEVKTNNKKISEYSEGYKLDDLEKMIREELKKGNKE